jgi:L-ascorbate metabolism protein UlaG (beta-lactamase superfamily)
MRHLGLSLAFLFCCVSTLPADDVPDKKTLDEARKGKIVIRWHGQSMFEIVTPKGTTIIVDPHLLEQYRVKEDSFKADLICISHPHTDHNQVGAVKDNKKVKTINAVNKETGEANEIKEEFKDVKIQTIGTFHDKVGGMSRGQNGVFIFEIDGMRIVHLGDLGHTLTPRQIKKIGVVDVLLIPAGGTYTINGLDAAKVIEELKPRYYAIPMHYGTLVYDWLLDLKKSGFIEEFKPEQIKRFRVNELLLDPKAPVPKEPTIALLHFWATPSGD